MVMNKSSYLICGSAAACLATALAGCTSTSWSQRGMAWAPESVAAPSRGPGGYRAGRPVPPLAQQSPASPVPAKPLPLPENAEREFAESDRDELPDPVRIPDNRSAERAPRAAEGPSIDLFPSIEPEEITLEAPLELTVVAPARRQVGGMATYRLTLRNAGDQVFEGLVVHCRFGADLVFSGTDRREVVQRVARLSPGEVKAIDLSLTSEKVGAHCCRFSVAKLDGDHEVELASRDACVEFATRHIEVDLLGPMQRTQGSRAEFNITLSNLSHRAIDDVEAVIAYDRALVVKEASAEADQRAGQLAWRLGRLRPMEKIQLQVEFECRTPAHRACVRIEARGADVATEHEEACLEVVAVPGTLDLRISDRNDPLVTGAKGAYEVTVQNIGLQAARRLVLEATLPENLKFGSASVRVGDQLISLSHTAESGRLVFDPIDQLAPNARVVYTFEVDALRAGPAEFRASLTSSLSGTAISVSEPTTIVDP